jgi:uncharacterized protein
MPQGAGWFVLATTACSLANRLTSKSCIMCGVASGEHSMSYSLLNPALFHLKEGSHPTLLGSHCYSCRESFFPRRRLCPMCSLATDEIELPLIGTLYSYTYVHVPSVKYGRLVEGGYGIGEVDLPDGPRIQTGLSGDPATWQIGVPMQIDLEVLDQSEGDELVTFCFRAKEPNRGA